MAFKDLGEWAELAGIKLPINGKTYALPPISAELGPRLQALVALGVDIHQGRITELSDEDKVVLDDAEEKKLYRDVLGDVYDEMEADDVEWGYLKHAAMTSVFDAVFDRETAEKYWESLGKAPEPNRAQRRASKPTAAEIKAKRPASTGGTTSRRATPAKAKAAGGRRSSSTGT